MAEEVALLQEELARAHQVKENGMKIQEEVKRVREGYVKVQEVVKSEI
jgi:hypothetical protein